MALGFGEAELLAVVDFRLHETWQFFVVNAIGTHYQHRGRGYGREALASALDVMTRTRRRYGLKIGVMARIDPRNEPSLRLFRGAGFEYLNEARGFQNWGADLPD